MKTHSLRFQLTAWYASLVTGVFVLLAALMYAGLSHYLQRNLSEGQLRRARQIGETLLPHINIEGETFVRTEIRAVYAPENNDRFIRITRPDGSYLYVSGTPRDQNFNPTNIPALPRTSQRDFARHEKLAGKDELIIGTLHYQLAGQKTYIIEVGAPTTGINSMLRRSLLQLAAGLPVIVVIAVSGAYLLIRRALAPVDHMARKAEQITQHNLSERLPVARTADELQRLSLSINHMIARLEDAFLNSKRFLADASHELRTPLTVMRGELENLAQNEQLEAELRETVGSVLEEVERLAKIVEGLLAISRLDAGEAQAEWVPVDLNELAKTTADQMGLLAQDRHLSISCTGTGRVLVQGDRARLKQVVVNLLDNAIKYTPERGRIALSVQTTNGHAVLEVTDTGPGIPAEALPRVFDRFYRVDAVRSREAGGAGLGLSIVKSICTAHGAQVAAFSTPGQGSRFRVEFPVYTVAKAAPQSGAPH